MTIMEWVSDLEGIDSISISLLNLVVDLFGGLSVFVKAVIEFDFLDESCS